MNFQYETERLNIRILSSDFAGKTLEFHKNNRSTFEKYDGGKPENFYTLPYQKSLLQCEYQMMLQQKAIRFWLFEKGNPDHIIVFPAVFSNPVSLVIRWMLPTVIWAI